MVPAETTVGGLIVGTQLQFVSGVEFDQSAKRCLEQVPEEVPGTRVMMFPRRACPGVVLDQVLTWRRMSGFARTYAVANNDLSPRLRSITDASPRP